MSIIAAETKFGTLSTASYPAGYDYTKLNLGPIIKQYAEAGNEGKFVGPVPADVARPFEMVTAFGGTMPCVVPWSSDIDWIFLADTTATLTSPRKIMMYKFTKSTHVFNFVGAVSLAFPSATTNYTQVALRVTYDKYTTGTATCAGGTTSVTGGSTTWSASRLAAGSRIAFGTTDPTTNPTWYEISSIGSDTAITLTTNGPNTGGAVSYVIEELRLVLVTTNNTTTSGGLYVAKGLRPEIFTSGVTAISAASSTDNVRAVYWLSDAASLTNITAKGAGIEPRVDWQTQYLWVLEGLASPNEILYKYNLRAALTPSTGKDSGNSLVLKTGVGGAYTGTISAINNMRFAQMASGPGSGLGCLYFTTTTKVYRTAATSTITAASTTWLSGGDVMNEIPPGGTVAFAATSVMNTIEYASSIDKLVIMTTAATTFKSYVTGYNTTSQQFDRIFTSDFKQLPQVASEGQGLAPLPSTHSTSGIGIWVEGGIAYMAVPGTSATTNFLYAFPMGADWEYTSTSNNVVITPAISTPNCTSFYRVFANNVGVIGGRTGKNLGACTEPYRIYYRTSGITTDLGSWTLVDYSGDISAAAASTSIQFKIEFRTIGHTNLPARLTNLVVLYNDSATDTHFQASVAQSNLSTSKFAWRFSTAFGGTPPTLYVRLYDATNSSTIYVTDNSATPTGTWEKSTDGGSNWSAFPLSDKGNEITYIRYTPASLGSGIKVRPVLSLS